MYSYYVYFYFSSKFSLDIENRFVSYCVSRMLVENDKLISSGWGPVSALSRFVICGGVNP